MLTSINILIETDHHYHGDHFANKNSAVVLPVVWSWSMSVFRIAQGVIFHLDYTHGSGSYVGLASWAWICTYNVSFATFTWRDKSVPKFRHLILFSDPPPSSYNHRLSMI